MTGGVLPSAREGCHKDSLRNILSAKQRRRDRARPKPTVNITRLSGELYTNTVTTV
jgi:hypothetical protein